MLTTLDLSKIRDLLRVEVLPRFATIETRLGKVEIKVDEVSRGVASLEFRLGDLADEVDALALSVNRQFARIERRLDAAHIPEVDDSDDDGARLSSFRPASS